MDPVVTARVPAGVRDRGNAVLKSIGSTPSELINCAYEYVVREKKLPHAGRGQAGGRRAITRDQAEELSSFMGDVHIAAPSSWKSVPFESLFDDAMGSRYADLR